MGSWFKPALLSTPSSNMAANSTVMYSGLNPDSRNSSKVLRPPGGGSSDIFGLKEAPEESKDQEVPDQPTDTDDSSNNEKVAENNDPVEEEPATEEPKQAETIEIPPPVQAPSPPVAGVRGRIPPGGHSSGSFW